MYSPSTPYSVFASSCSSGVNPTLNEPLKSTGDSTKGVRVMLPIRIGGDEGADWAAETEPRRLILICSGVYADSEFGSRAEVV